jgi:hypothetical protein
MKFVKNPLFFCDRHLCHPQILSNRGDLYNYKAGWSLLFHHSVRPHPDWLPVMWDKDTNNKSIPQIKWGK